MRNVYATHNIATPLSSSPPKKQSDSQPPDTMYTVIGLPCCPHTAASLVFELLRDVLLTRQSVGEPLTFLDDFLTAHHI